jgi:alkaline phosphatase
MRRTIVYIVFLFILAGCSTKKDEVQLSPVEDKPVTVPKNIIFMIGDGMGLTQITAARTATDNQLHMLQCETVGIQSTHAADEYVTDSGAATTAMACGQKTNYYDIGINVNGEPIQSIIEIAEESGLATGIITTSHIAHATPASFYAHTDNRFDYESIALRLLEVEVDFILGGGKQYFDQRTDGLNLIDSLLAKGYHVVQNLEQLVDSKKNAVFIADGHPSSYSEGRGDILPNSIPVALEKLKENPKGFFLVVEGAQIDWAGEENDLDYLIAEMLDFDRAVGNVLEFAKIDGNTLVVITGDHETGGFALLDGNEQQNTVEGAFITYLHTGSMVPVFAYGPGSEVFKGVYENTEIFYKFLDHLGFTLQ